MLVHLHDAPQGSNIIFPYHEKETGERRNRNQTDHSDGNDVQVSTSGGQCVTSKEKSTAGYSHRKEEYGAYMSVCKVVASPT